MSECEFFRRTQLLVCQVMDRLGVEGWFGEAQRLPAGCRSAIEDGNKTSQGWPIRHTGHHRIAQRDGIVQLHL